MGQASRPSSRSARKFTGRVTNITDYGAFVELEPGIEGLVHVSEMSWTKKNVHPGKIVSTSQEVEVMVLEIDGRSAASSLGLKQTQGIRGRPSRDASDGTSVEGEIKNITEFGLFVGLDGDIDGMVHLSDLDWNRPGEEAIQDYSKGDMVKARCSTSTPRRSASASDQAARRRSVRRGAIAGLKQGRLVTVTVTAVEDGGIEVELTTGEGFIRQSDLSRDRCEQRPERFTDGENRRAR